MAMRLAVIFAFLATVWASNDTTTTAMDTNTTAAPATTTVAETVGAPRQAAMMAPACAVAGLVTYSLM